MRVGSLQNTMVRVHFLASTEPKVPESRAQFDA